MPLSSSQLTVKSKPYYSSEDIERDCATINETKTFANPFSQFRLACIHKRLSRPSSGSANVVISDLEIDFTTISGIKTKCTIPIYVINESRSEIEVCFNGEAIDKAKYSKMYRLVNPKTEKIEPISHYHSEPFLVYYLTATKSGRNFLRAEFLRKGIIIESEESDISNVLSIDNISLNIHSSKVVCFNCSEFLRNSERYLMSRIYNSAALKHFPEKRKAEGLKFNISANYNFNFNSMSRSQNFEHIPVFEGDKSIITNTRDRIGEKEFARQLTGEHANRTYFLSGSTEALDKKSLSLIACDQAQLLEVANKAAHTIQLAWANYKTIRDLTKKASKLSLATSKPSVAATKQKAQPLDAKKEPTPDI